MFRHLGIEGGFEGALLVRSIVVPSKGRKSLPEPGGARGAACEVEADDGEIINLLRKTSDYIVQHCFLWPQYSM